ncbi:S26 family signal peptidase [Natranaeroarchaeum aerophilus]|uniref:S26 family signal peptidase n=1 Tax=Natranaeroarchaeum aerophilus TaxID=2917711 RepID=A0AAE3K349_9EURY|nr:S26 family signal peptidase [Natranaeroarchaeum aerophilus]MCL9812233.1 S26 family signal peptidase [Natranaeroarchaeum aerophilus]
MNDRRDGDKHDPPSPSDDDGDGDSSPEGPMPSSSDGVGSDVPPGDGIDPDESAEQAQGNAETVTPEQRRDSSGTTSTGGTDPGDDVPSPSENPIRWFLNTRNGSVLLFKDIASSIAIVAVIGLVLFTISGVWPPLVAIESGSMEPHMQKGDLVFLMENERLASSEAVAAGVVTHEVGQQTGYTKFGDYGDVIIFRPDGQERTPIIHRAHIYVEEGENWYDRADGEHLQADSCDDLSSCPAPHDGFVTKGDNPSTNQHYDQDNRYQVVKPEWVEGTAEVRVPYLGCIRLEFSGTASCRV